MGRVGCIGGLVGSVCALEAGRWKLPAGLYDGSRGRVLYVSSARFGAAWSYGGWESLGSPKEEVRSQHRVQVNSLRWPKLCPIGFTAYIC